MVRNTVELTIKLEANSNIPILSSQNTRLCAMVSTVWMCFAMNNHRFAMLNSLHLRKISQWYGSSTGQMWGTCQFVNSRIITVSGYLDDSQYPYKYPIGISFSLRLCAINRRTCKRGILYKMTLTQQNNMFIGTRTSYSLICITISRSLHNLLIKRLIWLFYIYDSLLTCTCFFLGGWVGGCVAKKQTEYNMLEQEQWLTNKH